MYASVRRGADASDARSSLWCLSTMNSQYNGRIEVTDAADGISGDSAMALLFVEPAKGQSARSDYDMAHATFCTCGRPVVTDEAVYLYDNGVPSGLAYVVRVGAAIASQLGDTHLAPLHFPGNVHAFCLGPIREEEMDYVRELLDRIGARGHAQFLAHVCFAPAMDNA